MTHFFYDKTFLVNALENMEDVLEDLSLWSVHNGDKHNNYVTSMKNITELLKSKIALEEANHEPIVEDYLKNFPEEKDEEEKPV